MRRQTHYDDLKGGTAVITGAGKREGIGFAIAQKLASQLTPRRSRRRTVTALAWARRT